MSKLDRVRNAINVGRDGYDQYDEEADVCYGTPNDPRYDVTRSEILGMGGRDGYDQFDEAEDVYIGAPNDPRYDVTRTEIIGAGDVYVGVEGDPTDPTSSNYDPTAVADPNATTDPNTDPSGGADAAAAAAAPAGDVRIKVQPIDAVVYDGSKGTPRYYAGSTAYFTGGNSNGYVWGWDKQRWPNSGDPARWIARRGGGDTPNDANWDDVTSAELADLQAASLKAGWGPLIGNPAMPDFANLHYAEDTKNYFWYPSQAPAWSTAEANAALAATNKQTADTLAAALAAQQALDQQQAQTDAHDVAVATAAAQKQASLQAIQDASDQGVQDSADAKAQAAAATQATADEASAQHDANVQAIQDAADARKQAAQDVIDQQQQAADDAAYQKQQDALARQYDLAQMKQMVQEGPQAQAPAQDDGSTDDGSDAFSDTPGGADSADDTVNGDVEAFSSLKRLRGRRGH